MEKKRLYLAYLTEPREIGESTPHSPQHLTLVPPFLAEPNFVIESAQAVGRNVKQFPARIGEIALLGPKKDLEVYTVEPLQLLNLLHNFLMDELERREVDTSHMKHIRDEYRPHITVKPRHQRLQKDNRLTIDHIAVMEKADDTRILLAKEELQR